MGGKDEGYVEPAVKSKEQEITPAERPTTTSAVKLEGVGSKKYRFHEDKGQVHFHGTDGDAHLKAALPVSER